MKQFEKIWHSGKWDTPHPGNPETLKVFAKRIYREALEWVKREAISLDERGDISRGIINRELEDK